MPEANPLNSHGHAWKLYAVALAWLAVLTTFYLYLCATHAPAWEQLTALACTAVTYACIRTLRRL